MPTSRLRDSIRSRTESSFFAAYGAHRPRRSPGLWPAKVSRSHSQTSMRGWLGAGYTDYASDDEPKDVFMLRTPGSERFAASRKRQVTYFSKEACFSGGN